MSIVDILWSVSLNCPRSSSCSSTAETKKENHLNQNGAAAGRLSAAL